MNGFLIVVMKPAAEGFEYLDELWVGLRIFQAAYCNCTLHLFLNIVMVYVGRSIRRQSWTN
jgi:hypothetical protein